MRKGLLLACAATAALAVGAGPAHAAPPAPFGHPCSPQGGLLFCPTNELTDRVPSWDGTPIDVDVLMPTGDGPFPTIVMLHGLGGDKTAFESQDPKGAYNNNFYAQRGYAVVTLSMRGWGRSCGKPDSRTSPGCDRGWTHLDDQAFEARDVQYLLGLLVDEGVTAPGAIGVTGVSLGGGLSNTLAFLHNQVRMPDGSFAQWTSPGGVPLQITAAWSRWGWSDLAYSLAPNGRFLETKDWAPGQTITPPGLEKKSFVGGFYFIVQNFGFTSPPGADPTSDLTTRNALSAKGEPYPKELADGLEYMTEHDSAAGLFQFTPSPLLVEDGWTDDVFTPVEALRIWRATAGGTKGPVSFQLGDLGHGRGANKPNEDAFFNAQGAAFFDAYLKKQGTVPAAGAFDVFTQTCPRTKPAGGPFHGATWTALHPGAFHLAGRRAQTVSSAGGDPRASKTFDSVAGGTSCPTAPAGKGKRTAVYLAKVRKGFTMVGLPLVKAKVATKGQFGQLDGQLYDRFKGKLTLVSRGAYRLTPNQKGRVTLELNGGGWKFAKGHTVELQLLGRDPNFLRPSNGKFTVSVSRLTASLPTRERSPR